LREDVPAGPERDTGQAPLALRWAEMGAALSLTLRSSTSDLERLQTEFRAFGERNGLPFEVRNAVSVALEEMILNIIHHGYQGRDDRPIDVSVGLDDERIVIVLEDRAAAYDPLATPTPDVTLPLEKRKPGGLGVYLTRGLMDTVDYRRTDDGNRLVLTKELPAPAG
jgi:anti-sigma regulatory factor (Ser/Thr protein kinase)